ncbi:hypothetical protein [Clostridium sp.]|uniref:hypothetical protein n=1 Tax=Clostridium sp. TaxID=1506 RepID=UPI001A46F08B|nr:hypothetical protein [Clostridium sp.]MBK5240646.1 hypothetical protein [Clostridium sp.]
MERAKNPKKLKRWWGVINEVERISIEASTSFLLRIKYRQNKSWQGTIQWLEGKQRRNFCSCLELMMLIEEALSGTAEGKRIEFHTWEGKEEEEEGYND